MSTKNLFDKGKSYKVLSSVDPDTLGLDAESYRNVRAKVLDKNRFVPNVDFSSASNFVKYGSAKKYYETAFDRITNEYPYDGSSAEKHEFFNSSSYLDLHLFDNDYPTTTGYITLTSDQWGTSTIKGTGAGTDDAWGVTDDTEYLHIIGGPHTASGGMIGETIHSRFSGSNIYDGDIYDTEGVLSLGKQGTRESNLKFDLTRGVTTEFWINKGTWLGSSLSDKEVIFDFWNGEASSSAGYGRLLIYLTGSSNGEDPIRAHLASGSNVWDISYGGSTVLTSSLTSNWKHVALTFVTGSTQLKSDFYYDGALQETKTNTSLTSFGEITGSLNAFVGALQTTPSGNIYHGETMIGAGKLSASLDEFRYWKAERTHEEVAKNYFRHVDGGANADIANTELGVYFKFNEGITTIAATDASVLDYSGRISNGVWVGYPAGTARNTGSAIVSSSAASYELEDPIIYSIHPDVTAKRAELVISGSAYDHQNNSSIYYTLPSWIIEEDDESGEILNLTQVVASYFDTLHAQMAEVPRLKDISYLSSSLKPYPFSNRLLESAGLFAPEIFVDASVLEHIKGQSETRFYDKDLSEIKNLIYQNIYNNLVYIYKTKGTEKSFRNVIRCYGVDDELIKVNLYGNNVTHKLRDNFRSSVTKKTYADFNHPTRFESTITHQTSSTNINTLDVTYISGTTGNSRTAEVEVIFPKKFRPSDEQYFKTDFLSSSVFGYHRVKTSLDIQDFSGYSTSADRSLQLYAVRPFVESKDAYFVLENPAQTIRLTSSVYQDLYDDTKWNFAIRTYLSKKEQADYVSGSAGTAGESDIIFELYGCNVELGIVKNQFSVTASTAQSATANGYITSPRRYYAGAHRVDFTGSITTKSDIKVSSVRHWESFLTNEEVTSHAKNTNAYGVLDPLESTHLYDVGTQGHHIPKIETLSLSWALDDVTGSDTDGEFLINDFSSGSIEKRTRYPGDYGESVGNQHTGRGFFFPASSTSSVSVEYVQTAVQSLPEVVTSYDMTNIMDFDDEIFEKDSRTINHFFAIEKSMYQTISEEMLNMFSTIVGFNNLIGEPVNRYRQEYKDMAKLRNLFFENVENVPDLDKYVDFYRWIDSSLSIILRQLIPASANTSEDVRTMIESHVLERNKYYNKFPALELKSGEIIAGLNGINKFEPDEIPNWRYAYAPISDSEADNTIYWKYAEATHPILSSSNADVNLSRNAIIRSKRGVRDRRYRTPYKLSAEVGIEDKVSRHGTGRRVIHGGINSARSKKVGSYRDVVSFGTADGFVFDNIKNVIDVNDVIHPMHKKYQVFEETNNSLKGETFAPFRVLSGSADGYNSSFGTFQAVNLHTDAYHAGGEIPLQSPFTEKFVGGHVSRHTPINSGSDDITNRAESWKLTTTSTSLTFAHPDTDKPRDTITRNVKAKRPVNIENLKITGSSALGNYSNIREVVQVAGRAGNNSQFVRNEGVSISHIVSGDITGIVDHEISQFSSSAHVIAEIFSAPGGPDVSRGWLDAETGQYSVYNVLPYRNLLVRVPLRTMLSASTSQFGFRPGATATSADYSGTANFHKINRNTLNRILYSNAYTGDLGTVATASVNDNSFITRPIPQSDLQYVWLTGSYESTALGGTRSSGRTMLGYAPRDFEVSTSAGYVNAITFASQSHIAAANTGIPVDLIGLNTVVNEPISASQQTLGYPLTTDAGSTSSPYNTNPTNNVGSGQVLSALMAHRRSLSGFSTWRQIRTGEHPVARVLRESHIISIENNDKQTFSSGGRVLPAQRHGGFTQYRESPVISKHKPIIQSMADLNIGSTYGNNISYYSNLALNRNYAPPQQPQLYDKIKSAYGADFNYLRYSESVYPAEKNAYDNRIRLRKGYTIDYWHSNRQTREDNKANKISLGSRSKYSIWAMDAKNGFATSTTVTAQTDGTSPAGELQNYGTYGHYGNKQYITASALYSLKHWVATTASVAAPSGIAIAESAGAAGTGDRIFGFLTVGGGNALWEAGSLSGRIEDGAFVSSSAGRQSPAYDSYEDYALELRGKNKDFSIVPEFRISDHLDFYINKSRGDFLAANSASFDIFGATSSADFPTESSQEQFYNVYTNSDFLKYFEVVKRDHEGIADDQSVTLKCKALMKFLPYNGFYPAERTLQMATQFSSSYANHVEYTGADSTYENAKIRPFLETMFAPGVVYNSIKSGIGVPYPVLTSSYDVQALGSYYAISSSNNGSSFRMIDFEAAVEPEKYLSRVPLVDMEAHPSASLNLTASWSGRGDPLYSMMAHNFFGEVPEFFLPQGNVTTITSLPESDPRFGNAISGSVYAMRIKMFRSMNAARSSSAGTYDMPQDNPLQDNLRETFTMYSRPTAFFHAVTGREALTAATDHDGNYGQRMLDSYSGYNWVATPPYYHGEAWLDIQFTADTTKKYTLAEVLGDIDTVFESRFDNNTITPGNDAGYYHESRLRDNILKLTDTLITDGRARIKSVDFDPVTGRPTAVRDDPTANHVAWVVQPKWETPMFDFGDTGVRPITNAAGNLTLTPDHSGSIPRGMWHQFGLPPDSPDKGIFLQITDIPQDWLENHPGVSAQYYNNGSVKSLVDVFGFDQTPHRLGEVALHKTVSEAVIAVPFVEKGTTKKFFPISRGIINKALAGDLEEDNSIRQMVEKLQNYVLPPKMDFLTCKHVKPFAMYVFEFEHIFDKDDLAHIWQNLPPKSIDRIEEKQATVTHKLLSSELLGIDGMPTGLRWMVFKVKKKAIKNYFSKTASKHGDNLDDKRYKFEFEIAGRTKEIDYSYNWPYDFFSLVEMVKIDAEVEFRGEDE